MHKLKINISGETIKLIVIQTRNPTKSFREEAKWNILKAEPFLSAFECKVWTDMW